MKSRFVLDLLEALCRIDPQLAEHAVGHMLTWPKPISWMPFWSRPCGTSPTRSTIARELAVAPLRDACLAHLRTPDCQKPLAPLHDGAGVACSPANAAAPLLLFFSLLLILSRGWAFKAVEAERSRCRADDPASSLRCGRFHDRRGRPYTLVCTKTRWSYDRRAKAAQQRSGGRVSTWVANINRNRPGRSSPKIDRNINRIMYRIYAVVIPRSAVCGRWC